jgi:transcriptional regulator with XRE-family HTH domain
MLSKAEQILFYQKLGEAIKNARKNAGCKQETLANHMGLTRISLVHIEQGKQKVQLHVLLEIAECLKISLVELMPSLDSVKGPLNPKLEKNIKRQLGQFDSKDEVDQTIRDFVALAHTKS